MQETTFTGVITVVLILVCIGVIGLLAFGIPAYSRYQTRQDANNEVQINEIRIQQQAQLIQVEKQKAEIRVQEAKGIAEAQKLINSSLTDKYLQHEAIEAQMKMAGSPNHTQIYIPVGQNGLPIVKTVD